MNYTILRKSGTLLLIPKFRKFYMGNTKESMILVAAKKMAKFIVFISNQKRKKNLLNIGFQ